ncbi:MAG: DNA/pantothenate metabolism flavoprotein, partial [Methanosarcinales archaeon]|nr:DNA/pantothenate metabolism flavoprotein [Methanosarcinales archaeon]
MELSDKTIVLGITGSIAAVRCVELARELRRRGASVIAVMSKAATEIIHPNAMEFATGNPVITGITGRVEHVALCAKADYPGVVGADLLLIAPATANTIGKMAQGIDDTSVTTFATTAIGAGVPVVVVPAMHGSMYSNPFVKKNIDALKKADAGVIFVGPYMDEGKAKMAEEDDIVLHVER